VTESDFRDAPREEAAASEVVVDTGPEHQPTMAKELLRTDAGDVQAGTVLMERAGAEQVTGERVVMTNSGARTVEARSAQVDHSGILIVNGDKAVFSNSTVVAAMTGEARIVRSLVLLLKADRAEFEGEARIAVYAGPADASVRPLVDARGAAAFGAGLGIVLALCGAIARRIFRGAGRSTA
jgi:hypothetical protein